MDFCVWEKGVAGDDHGRGIGTGTPLDGNAAGVGSAETEQVGKSAGRVLFDHGQGGRDFIRVDVGVEGGEDEFGGEAGGVGRGVEFAHEAAVPGVDGVLQDLLRPLEEARLARARVGQVEIHELGQLVGFVVFDEGGAGATSLH